MRGLTRKRRPTCGKIEALSPLPYLPTQWGKRVMTSTWCHPNSAETTGSALAGQTGSLL